MHVHQVPVLPELVLAELPAGTHVLVMTHDHAEDVALCDAALRSPPRLDRADRLVGEVGAVPARLLADGHDPAAIERIRTPDRAARLRPARSRPRSR